MACFKNKHHIRHLLSTKQSTQSFGEKKEVTLWWKKAIYTALGTGRDSPDKINATQRYDIQNHGNNQTSADTMDQTISVMFLAVLVTRGCVLCNP